MYNRAMRRRTFLSTSAAAGMGIPARLAANPAAPKAGDIPRRVFGKTGEKLTIIGQAGGRFIMCGYEDAKAITLRATSWALTTSTAPGFIGTENPRKSMARF